MAYNTKPIIRDKDGNPISQYYNPSMDIYEPVEGVKGANKVVIYKSNGVENSDLSLVPILDKLSQLTGTVIDEETRKSNELQRIELYNQIFKMLANGELKGDKGNTGKGLEFDWQGTILGVRIQGDTEYVYVDLRGPKGDRGATGSITNLDKGNIEDALGYLPVSEIDIIETDTTLYDFGSQMASAINESSSNLVKSANPLGYVLKNAIREMGKLKDRIVALENKK